mmetsp:Transcript_20026/g.19006  ORF Transcript_20026/g.19006 Transcript_20026/m.19006 type:complete len:189 (+) Transcript_20026:63-629(+)
MSASRTSQAGANSLMPQLKDLITYIQQRGEHISKSKRGRLLKVSLSIIQEFVTASQFTRQLLNGYQMHHVLLFIISQQQLHQQNNQEVISKDHDINAKILDIFVLWLNTDSQQIESFLARKQTLEVLFNIFLTQQQPKNKVYQYVFGALNRIITSSMLVSKSLFQNEVLMEKLVSSIIVFNQMLIKQS